MTQTPENITKFQEQLNEQRINEFIDSLLNPEDPDRELANLKRIADAALVALVNSERTYVQDLIKDSNENDHICPGCLIANTRDVSNIQNVRTLFESYVREANDGCEI